MSDKSLSLEEIQEIESRLAITSKGPWREVWSGYVVDRDNAIVSETRNVPDTDFIIRAHDEDVPVLLQEVKRQRAALDAIRDKLQGAALALRGALTDEAERNVLEALEAAGGEAPEQTPITEAMAALRDSPAGEAWDAVEDPDDYLLRERFGGEEDED